MSGEDLLVSKVERCLSAMTGIAKLYLDQYLGCGLSLSILDSEIREAEMTLDWLRSILAATSTTDKEDEGNVQFRSMCVGTQRLSQRWNHLP